MAAQITSPLIVTAALALIIGGPESPPSSASGNVDPPAGPATDAFLARLADAHVQQSSDGFFITALDAAGETLGTLSLELDDQAELVHLSSDYADGYGWVTVESVTFDHVVEAESTLPETVLAARATAIVQLIQAQPQARGEWFWCATHVGAAIGVCAGAAVSGGLLYVGCAATSAAATCKCITAWAAAKGKRKCAE